MEELISTNYSELCKIAKQIVKDDELWEDLLHDAVCIALTTTTPYVEKGKFIGWMKTVILNQFLNYKNKASTKRTVFSEEATLIHGNARDDVKLDDVYIELCIQNKISDPIKQKVIRLYLEGWYSADIATELGISQSKVLKTLYRFKQEIGVEMQVNKEGGK
jgi:RNA polymerase sigma factor (sigma-70 family)